MISNLPNELWSRILSFIDFDQRMEVCTMLINSGCVKISKCIFHTYMLLLDESKQKDEKKLLEVILDNNIFTS